VRLQQQQQQELHNEHKKRDELHDLKRSKKATVLLVDDEPDICMVYQMVLEDAGYQCSSYTDSVKALQDFKPHFYDLVILDIKMPVLNGFELCRKIREVDSTIEIIFITALSEHYRNVSQQQSYPEFINATTYLQKPVENEDLVQTVDRILRRGNIG